MRRAISIAIGIVFVAAIGTAMWWHRWSAPPSSSRQASGGGVASAPTTSTNELVLQIDGMATATISRGAPVFFSVTLTGPAPPAWASSLRFETGDGKPVGFRIDPLGSSFTVTTRTGSLDMGRVELGVSVEEAARIAAGTHAIRAVLPLDAATSGKRPLVSNTVTLTLEGSESAAAAAGGEKARLESAARFNLLSEKWQEAHDVAVRLVEREDADAAAYILLGDALNGLKRDREALAAYHEAFAALPRDVDESPDYLIARIEEVQRRLEAANEKKEP